MSSSSHMPCFGFTKKECKTSPSQHIIGCSEFMWPQCHPMWWDNQETEHIRQAICEHAKNENVLQYCRGQRSGSHSRQKSWRDSEIPQRECVPYACGILDKWVGYLSLFILLLGFDRVTSHWETIDCFQFYVKFKPPPNPSTTNNWCVFLQRHQERYI